MQTGRRQLLAATVVGGGLCVALAFVSALTPPQLITAVPSAPPRGDPAPRPSVSLVAPTSAPDLGDQMPAPQADVGAALTIAVTILAVALGIVLIVAALRAARAVAARERPEPLGEVVESAQVDARDVSAVLQRAGEQIERDDDANLAVIRCWHSLEALGAAAGVPRPDNATATEYVVGILADLDVPTADAERLAQLYARALFSDERLGPPEVRDARDCLTRLGAALENTGTVAG